MDRKKNLGSLSRTERIRVSSHKTVPPYTLDERLTFYCPQENLESLNHPIVKPFHDHMLKRYRPPRFSGKATMLILPCTRTKPYHLSAEHQAINRLLDTLGFKPTHRSRRPAGLRPSDEIPEALLEISPLRKGARHVHRMVISEPMGLVPYEYLYYFKGGLSPVSRYDDPGLFEHRRNAVCLWRKDSTAEWGKTGYAWGNNEREAYVTYHNVLVEILTRTLVRLRSRYAGIVAYVSPKLTHRSFLASRDEKRAGGLPIFRKVRGKRMDLIGVNDLGPGLVEVLPKAEGFTEARARLAGRLERSGASGGEAKVRAHFARGGGGGTPLMLPEVLEILKRRIA
ncbi:MAG: DUF5591 domain-containing protein [Nitrospinota bacterium]|jgi:hypothetical protein|nr:DUF5591 domain-containing protein [Nitrospinota bacterium]MDP6618985.1 DUF5591 domain-containing protein [Nitrospinota bacterium]HJM41768.1 DUF5591 domain-containing protein [Nitrospinota bacterium]